MLMATSATPEVLDHVVAPHPAFLLEIPPGLLSTMGRTGKMVDLTHIQVQRLANGCWNFTAESPPTSAGVATQLWRYNMPTEMLLKVTAESVCDWSELEYLEEIEDRDDRVFMLIGRLIISACLAMSDPDNFEEKKKSKGKSKGRRKKKEPDTRAVQMRHYVLGHKLELDCRPMLVSYLDEGKSRQGQPLSIQFPVRSHWRRVAHGPKGALRRIQKIDSYWKGPDEARILREEGKR